MSKSTKKHKKVYVITYGTHGAVDVEFAYTKTKAKKQAISKIYIHEKKFKKRES